MFDNGIEESVLKGITQNAFDIIKMQNELLVGISASFITIENLVRQATVNQLAD